MSVELYLPLRDRVRQLALIPSLYALNAYFRWLQLGVALPEDVELHAEFRAAKPGPDVPFFPWELDLLTKEVLLHARRDAPGDLRRWRDFAELINLIKTLENDLMAMYSDLYEANFLVEMYRIAHRQFPWQARVGSRVLARHYKLLSAPPVDALVVQSVGVDTRTLYRSGLASAGLLLNALALRLPLTSQLQDVDAQAAETVLNRFALPLPDLRQRIDECQSYDTDFAYAYNPLKLHPLVRITIDGVDHLLCPVPDHLLRRFTDGVFFEIVRAPGFSAAFGDSFQAYIGEVLNRASQSRYSVLAERAYSVAGREKRSVDWIVSDDSGDVFLECKTKRIRYAAKFALTDRTPLEEDIGTIAQAVVQTYKAIRDALAGRYPHWRARGLPLYPLIVTLDEWYLFNQELIGLLDQKVRQGVEAAGLPEEWLDEHPYSICSVDEFELIAQIQAAVGVAPVMYAKCHGQHRQWVFDSVLREVYSAELASCSRNLFPEVMESIRTAAP
jgi:hypothetical protein